MPGGVRSPPGGAQALPRGPVRTSVPQGRSVRVKRVYEEPASRDGLRVLVDRLWPRGLSKERAGVSKWLKEAGPSTGLRKWFDHDPDRWEEFKRRYLVELEQGDTLNTLVDLARRRRITLLFGSREERCNNAMALKGFIESSL